MGLLLQHSAAAPPALPTTRRAAAAIITAYLARVKWRHSAFHFPLFFLSSAHGGRHFFRLRLTGTIAHNLFYFFITFGAKFTFG